MELVPRRRSCRAALADVLTSSRMFSYLAAATPGMRELLTVGKVWELAQDATAARRGPRRTTSSSSMRPRPATASPS